MKPTPSTLSKIVRDLRLNEAPRFSKDWTQFIDEIIPQFTKERFHPDARVRAKPFDEKDIQFFGKGLLELSAFFTEERMGQKLPNYFTTPKFRSSYLLYFLPVQAAKFYSLFSRHRKAMECAYEEALQSKVFRIIDVGSGPGTASFAALLWCMEDLFPRGSLPFKIELIWIDRNEAILNDGEALLEKLLEAHPEWEGDLSLKKETRDWWKHPKNFDPRASLVLFGNVLNETRRDPGILQAGLLPFIENRRGAGVFFLEPAFKSSAQFLSLLRDEMTDGLPDLRLWGPCLHLQKCPLSEGRDWCHFSVPVQMPGKWFRKLSIKLGGIRDWLKFSYLWIAAEEGIEAPEGFYRVVSDPIRSKGSGPSITQLCAPNEAVRIPTPTQKLFRGDLWELRTTAERPSASKRKRY